MEIKGDPLRFDEFLTDKSSSFFQKYQDLVLGERHFLKLLHYELLTLLIGQLPGALGLGLRSLLYPSLFHHVGRKVVFGHHLTLRSPSRIQLGHSTVIEDYVLISVRALGDERIEIGSSVLIGRYSQLKARLGSIFIGDYANIGAECRIDSTHEVHIGEYCLFGGRCYIGGVNHAYSRTDIPILRQPLNSKGGVRIGRDVWLGAGVIVNDGVTIGEGAVVGAGAVVTKNIPPYAIAMGVPAQVRGWRVLDAASGMAENFSQGTPGEQLQLAEEEES